MKKKRPVLQDVADRVGVTKMTVSRFLRNPEQVSVALRGKIAAALDELGYIPNRAPDILSNATSRAIGVLLPSLTNQVFAEVLRGIESVTDAHGYQTMLAHYGYKPEMEQERLESMLSWNIDGLILTERAVNGVYQGSGEQYQPLHKTPTMCNVFIGISCIAGFLLCGWLGLLIGALFGTVYVRQGLAGKMGNVVGAFVGCTVIQLLIMVIVVFLQLA